MDQLFFLSFPRQIVPEVHYVYNGVVVAGVGRCGAGVLMVLFALRGSNYGQPNWLSMIAIHVGR